MKNKITIYLCDLVHNYLDVGTYVFPLNVGYIAVYANKFFSKDIDIKLFKYPMDFIKQFKNTKPDIVGFSNYTWSADLNNKISKWIKSSHPETIVIFGGPNINCSSIGYKSFFTTHNSVDFYVPYQGETPFVNILKEITNGLSLDALRSKPIDGVISYDKDSNTLICGKDIPRIKDLDAIPSPYLTGLLNEFFNYKLIPMMETNRGCPYNCTFCTQGFSSHNQLNFFSLERIKDEVKYIVSRVKNTNMLNFADANFSIADRDFEIAKYVMDLAKKTGYPRKLLTNCAKNQPKIFEMAKILKTSILYISLQSLDETVLKNIKRTNIKLSVFKDIINKINASGDISGTEIILGLPGETKESHIQTIRSLFAWNVSYIICYNVLLLEGTEMSSSRESGIFQPKTKFRLIDNSFGKYEDIVSLESEEGIRSTPTMSEADILYFRPVHWLIQFLWNYRFYYDLLKYLQSLQINPADYILKLIDNAESNYAPKSIKKIFDEFKQEAKNEWFDSPEVLQKYYSQTEQFKVLEEGCYGKMNGKYIFRVLFEALEDFNIFLYQIAINYSPVCQSKKAVFKDIFSLLSASIIDFMRSLDEIPRERIISCKYDILNWRNSKYKDDLEQFYHPEGIQYLIYLPEGQKQSLKTLFKQYTHKNKNAALRKMSEHMYIGDFFYKIKLAEESIQKT